MRYNHFPPSFKEYLGLALLGCILGFLLFTFEKDLRYHFIPRSSKIISQDVVAPQVRKERPLACRELAFCQPATFGFQGKTHEEEAKEQALLRRRLAARAAAQAHVPILKNAKNPNSIRIPLSQAPPLTSAKKVNGKWVCAHRKDKPRKSKQDKEVHIDRQCCLDPDEVPNPRCSYR